MKNLFSFLIAFILINPAIGQKKPAHPPLGKLVDVGNFKMHIYTTGQGKTPVVLLPGSGHFSLHWSLVQRQVEKFAQVSSLDYAGSGWSEYGPLPQTLQQTAHNLHTLLHKSQIKIPYALVGQSLGGLLARKYAETYPKEVAGIVLVDATVPDMLMLTYKTKTWEHWRKRAKKRPIPAVKTTLDVPIALKTLAKGLNRDLGDLSRFSKKVQTLFHWFNTKPFSYPAKSGGYYLPEELQELYQNRLNYPLGSIPLKILAAKKISQYDKTSMTNERRMAHKHQTQKELLRLSRKSSLQWVDSGHHIHIDKPEVVVKTIRELLGEIEKG